MVNSVATTDGTANVTSSSYTSMSAAVPPDLPDGSASALSAASTLSQHLNCVKSECIDVFAAYGLPPDRATEHAFPLEPDAQPPFKRMYRLSPSELVEVRR